MKEVKNKKGFTLVELLAVIVILGLLMAIAIPSVTKYITQSRKKTLISSVDSYVTAVTTAVNDNEFGAMSKEDTMYYVPVSNNENNSCVSLEKGGTDPFGNWMQAYVVVNYDADKYSYDYYFTFFDDAGYGMELTEISKIDASSNLIINPSPVDASNITTQKNNRASNIKVLTSNSCEVSTAVNGGPNVSGNTNNNGGGNQTEINKYQVSGVWKLKETFSFSKDINIYEYVNYSVNGKNYKIMNIFYAHNTLPSGSVVVDSESCLRYAEKDFVSGANGIPYYGDLVADVTSKDEQGMFTNVMTWYSYNANSLLNFGSTPQTVSQEFYEWFIANASKVG